MRTQWLFFAVEQDAIDYEAACRTFIDGNEAAQAWLSDWDNQPEAWSHWWQTTDDAEQWPEGDAAGILGYFAVAFLGIPFFGGESDYREPPERAFPLNDGGSPAIQYDRDYWLATIPNTAATFVYDLTPEWPAQL